MTDGFDPLFREVNLRIHELTRGFWEPAEYLCECGDAACQGTMIALQPSVFADLIALHDVALVMPRHEPPDTEIVRQGRGYLLVRKTIEPIEETMAQATA